MTDSIYWEAQHEAESEFRGATISVEHDMALLAYRGAAKRKGMLFWQGVTVESPSEITAVRMGSDEPSWTRQFGEDWDFSKVQGDAFYQCLSVNVIGASSGVFCVGIRKGEEVWEILGLKATSGETLWSAEGTEPASVHLDAHRGLLWVQSIAGDLSRLDVVSGARQVVLEGNEDGVFATVEEGGCIHYSEEAGELTRLGSDGGVKWFTSSSRSTVQPLEEGIVISKGRCFLVDTDGLRALDDKTGQAMWSNAPDIFEGTDTATISCVGERVLLQVAGKQKVCFLCRDTGVEKAPDSELEPLFWGPWGGDEALSCGKSGLWLYPSGGGQPEPLWDLGEERRLIQWASDPANGAIVALVLGGGAEEATLEVGAYAPPSGFQPWLTLSEDAIPSMAPFPSGVVLQTDSGIQVLKSPS